jgi:hypothetical protein
MFLDGSQCFQIRNYARIWFFVCEKSDVKQFTIVIEFQGGLCSQCTLDTVDNGANTTLFLVKLMTSGSADKLQHYEAKDTLLKPQK